MPKSSDGCSRPLALRCRAATKRFYYYEHRTSSVREGFIRLLRRQPLHVRRPEFTLQDFSLEIRRGGTAVFQGEVSAGQLKRPFEEMAGYLFRSQSFPNGAVLLTGTGIVPPDSFTLASGDVVRISIGGVGVLENTVVVV